MKRTFITVLSILAMATFAYAQNPASKRSSAETQIRAVLDITAVGWNTGDLSKYLYAYVPEATEMLSTGPAGGVEAIEKTMKEGFWKTGRPIQKLRYENLVVRMLGKENALVTVNTSCPALIDQIGRVGSPPFGQRQRLAGV